MRLAIDNFQIGRYEFLSIKDCARALYDTIRNVHLHCGVIKFCTLDF